MTRETTNRKASIGKRLVQFAVALMLILVAAVLAALTFISTGAGRTFTARQIEQALSSERLNIEVGTITGSLLSDFSISEIIARDDEGLVWDMYDIDVSWAPFQLIHAALDIKSLKVTRGTLYRLPEEENGPDADETTPITVPSLPVAIRLDSLAIPLFNLTETSGAEAALAIAAQHIEISEQAVTIAAGIRDQGENGDTATLSVHHSNVTGEMRLAADVNGAANGLLATILGLEEAISLSAVAQGSIDRWDGQARVTLGARKLTDLTFEKTDTVYRLDAKVEGTDYNGSTLPDLLKQDFNVNLTAGVEDPLETIQASVSAAGLDVRLTGGLRAQDRLAFNAMRVDIALNPERFSPGSFLKGAIDPLQAEHLTLNGTLMGDIQAPGIEAALSVTAPTILDYAAETIDLKILANPVDNDWTIDAQGHVEAPQSAAIQDLETYLGARIDLEVKGRVNSTSGAIDLTTLTLRSDRFLHRLSGQRRANGCLDLHAVTDASIASIFTEAGHRADADPASLDIRIRQPDSCDRAEALVVLTLPDLPKHYTSESDTSEGFKPDDYNAIQKLIGREIRLTADISKPSDGAVSVEEFTLESAAAVIKLDGLITEDNIDISYALNADNIGSLLADQGVDAAGVLKLSGTVRGALSEPTITANLDPISLDLQGVAFTDIGLTSTVTPMSDGVYSSVSLTGQSDLGAIEGALDLTAPTGGGVNFKDLALAIGDFSLRSELLTVSNGIFTGTASTSGSIKTLAPGINTPFAVQNIDLTLNLTQNTGEQAIALSGSVGGGHVADIALPALTLSLNSVGDTVTYSLSTTEQAPSDYAVAASGELLRSERGGLVNRLDASGKIGPYSFAARKPLTVTYDGGALTLDIQRLALGDGEVNALVTRSDSASNADIKIDRLPVGLLGISDPQLALLGTLSLDAQLVTNQAQPDARFDIRIDDLNRAEADLRLDTGLSAAINGQLNDNYLMVAGSFGTNESNWGTLDARLPLVLAGQSIPTIDQDAALEATVSLQQDIEPFWKLAALQDDELTGTLTGAVNVGGTLTAPRFEGTLSLAEGHYENLVLGLVANDIAADINFDDQNIDITRATALDGSGGTLDAGGSLTLSDNFELTRSSLRLTLSDYTIVRRAEAEARVTADLRLEDRPDLGGLALTGDLSMERADFIIPERLPTTITPLEVIEINGSERQSVTNQPSPASKTPPIYLSLKAKASRRFFVRGRGLDSEWGGDLVITGTSEKPKIAGTIDLNRGSFAFAGKTFILQQGTLFFDGTATINPTVKFSAVYETNDITARLDVSGRLDAPELSLSATPDLPQDEILSRILFGASATDLSPIQLLELASALSSLSGQGNLDAVGGVRRFVGLDRLTLENGGEDEGSIISGGKYLTNNIFLSLSTSTGTGETAAEIEVEITKNLSLRSRLDPSRDNNLSLRWSWDYR